MIKINFLKKTILFSSVFVLLCSCAAPKLTNLDRGNYKYETNLIQKNKEAISVSVSALPIPKPKAKTPEKPKSFFDLRDSIPHTYLKVLGEKVQSADELVKFIKQPLSTLPEKKKTEAKKETNFTKIKLRFMFSNIKRYYNYSELMHPNTRLEILNTTITLKADSNAEIFAIDKLENEFEQIDLGTLERNKNVEFGSKLNYDNSLTTKNGTISSVGNQDTNGSESSEADNVYDADGNLLGSISNAGSSGNTSSSKTDDTNEKGITISKKAELNYANTENIKEALAVKYKKLKTGFSFNPKQITISQRGRMLSDISDNVLVTATLNFKNTQSNTVFTFDKLFSKNEIQTADSQEFSQRLITYAPCKEDVVLNVKYEGAIRAVRNTLQGRNSLEFDDNVTYYPINDEQIADNVQQNVISKFNFCKKVYVITAVVDKKEYTLNIATNNYNNELNLFEDENPQEFLYWLKALIRNPSELKLKTDKFKLFFISNKKDSKGNLSEIILVDSQISDNNLLEIKAIESLNLVEKYK